MPSQFNSVIAVQRMWQSLSGLVTSTLVVACLSPTEQGWYYSLLSVAALFTLFDLGLSQLITQRAAALAPQLKVVSDWRRMIKLVRYTDRHYRWAACSFVMLLLPLGWLYFAQAETTPGEAVANGFSLSIWIALVFATAANLWILGAQSLLEGLGRIGQVYATRLAQGIAGAVSGWAVLLAGGGLWVVICIPLAGILVNALWFLPQLGRSLRWFSGPVSSASPELVGMSRQRWRLGAAWISGYLLAQVYVPLLLKTEGAAVAGQFGLSLAVANMLALVSQTWLTQAFPVMAAHAGQGNWRDTESVFRRAMGWCCCSYWAGAALVLAGLWLAADTGYPQRLLPLSQLTALLVVTFVNQFCGMMALQLRAAGQEPLTGVSVGAALLTLAGAWLVIGRYGLDGLLAVMLGIQLTFALPATLRIWSSCRKDWK